MTVQSAQAISLNAKNDNHNPQQQLQCHSDIPNKKMTQKNIYMTNKLQGGKFDMRFKCVYRRIRGDL